MAVGRTFLADGLHLGPGGNVRTFNNATLPFGGQVGQIFEQDGNFFRLVKHAAGVGTVATIDGGVAYWKTRSTYTVTADASDGEALANGVCGGYHAVITDTNYCFIQVGGDQKAVVVAASTVAADHLTGHASTDNVLTRTAAGTAPVDKLAATALSTRGATTSDVGASVSNSSKVRWVLGNLIS